MLYDDKMRTRNVRGISDANWDWLKRVAAFEGLLVGQLVDRVIEEWATEWSADHQRGNGSALAGANVPLVQARSRGSRHRTKAPLGQD